MYYNDQLKNDKISTGNFDLLNDVVSYRKTHGVTSYAFKVEENTCVSLIKTINHQRYFG